MLAIAATVKFSMGIDIRHVDISVNLGLPESAEVILQQNGQAGRDRTHPAVGLTYVEASHVTVALNSAKEEHPSGKASTTVSAGLAKTI